MGFAGLLKNNYKYKTCWMQMTCFLYSWWVTLFKLCEQVLVIQERERERDAYNTQYFGFFSEDKGYDSSSEDTDDENQSTYERFKRRVTKELKINNS